MWGSPKVRSVVGMTWSLLHERMAFMADLIEKAADDPDAALRLNSDSPDLHRLFGGEEGLLLSLQQRWVTALTAKLDQAAYQGIPVGDAIAELTAEQQGLSLLVDAAARRSAHVRALRRSEQRIIDHYSGRISLWQTIA